MQNNHWQCPKCNHQDYETDQISTTSGGLSKFLNVQNRKFIAVTCTYCSYTEFYKAETSTAANIIDFLGN